MAPEVVEAVEASSITTSQCGNVSLMALGILVLGLTVGGLTALTGQAVATHQALADAMTNAVTTLQKDSAPPNQAQFARLVEEQPGMATARIIAFHDAGSGADLSIQAIATVDLSTLGVRLKGWQHPTIRATIGTT